jgi:hypothetical protein
VSLASSSAVQDLRRLFTESIDRTLGICSRREYRQDSLAHNVLPCLGNPIEPVGTPVETGKDAVALKAEKGVIISVEIYRRR